jgi:ribosomal protein L5
MKVIIEHADRHIKDVIIAFLRLYFRNPKNYRHKLPKQIPEDRFKDTSFYDCEPEKLRKFPTVIVTTFGGSMVTMGLSDFCQAVTDPRTGHTIAYRYQGGYEFTTQIDIGCKTTLEREVLADLISKALRFSLRRFIQNQGIIIKNVSYAGDSSIEYNSDKIYLASIKIDTWSSWVEDVELLDPEEFTLKAAMSLKDDAMEKTFSNNNVTEKDYEKNNEDS